MTKKEKKRKTRNLICSEHNRRVRGLLSLTICLKINVIDFNEVYAICGFSLFEL